MWHWTLHIASSKGHLNFVSYLIEHNADITAKDNDEWTAFHYALENYHHNIVSYLIEHNADINTKTNYGKTALHKASENGYFDIVNAKDDNGSAAIHISSRKEIQNFLIQHGAHERNRARCDVIKRKQQLTDWWKVFSVHYVIWFI